MRRRSIAQKTSELPLVSKALYRIDHYSSMPTVAIGVIVAVVAVLLIGVAIGFPNSWVVAFEVTTSALTLLMVFTIQHTQGREQAATQRKLDELLRAIPGAAESLMLLEEAPQDEMVEVEEYQRVVREDLVDDSRSEASPPRGD